MIGAAPRSLSSAPPPVVRGHADRAAQKEFLQLPEHLCRGRVPVQEVQHLVLDRVVAHGPVDLQVVLVPGAALGQRRGRRPGQHAFQVGQEQGGGKVLLNGQGRLPAPVLQVQSALEQQIISLLAPAPVIQPPNSSVG